MLDQRQRRIVGTRVSSSPGIPSRTSGRALAAPGDEGVAGPVSRPPHSTGPRWAPRELGS